MPQAFFSFTLHRAVDINTQAFSISVLQQGNRLGHYRLKEQGRRFDPANFNIVLMKATGEFI